jgi:hypothetical protein
MDKIITNVMDSYVEAFLDSLCQAHPELDRENAVVLWQNTKKDHLKVFPKTMTTGKPKTIRPKQAPSAYILFSNETRVRLRTEQPDLTFSDIAKELGRLWREETTEEERQKYKDEHDRLKEILLQNTSSSSSSSSSPSSPLDREDDGGDGGEGVSSPPASLLIKQEPPSTPTTPKKRKNKLPSSEADIYPSDPVKRNLYREFSDMTQNDLKSRCDEAGIKPAFGKNKHSMIHALVEFFCD